MNRPPRTPSINDFTVPVPKVGTFTFAKRTMGDEMQIQVEYSRILDGVQPVEWLALLATWTAALRVLTVKAPEGWDLETMDPLDQDSYNNLFAVYTALRAKEDSFRPRNGNAGQAAGAGPGENHGDVVSQAVQPPAERS